jgi:hypothetical protein
MKEGERYARKHRQREMQASRHRKRRRCEGVQRDTKKGR